MTDDIARLGRFVLERRRELDLTQLDVAAMGGPSNTTLTGIESGTRASLSGATLRKLDAAMRWFPGSARAVLQGGEPQSLEALSEFVAAPGARLKPEVTNADLLRAMHEMTDAIREMNEGNRELRERLERGEGRARD